MKNQAGIRAMKKIILTSSTLLLLLAFALSGCQSPQERKGVSKLPQNRPAKWEQGNNGPGINF
jgi:hypothetical protein